MANRSFPRAETFRVIDPTNGRIHAKRACERDAKRDAIVIAGCRGAAVIIRNGPMLKDVLPRIVALVELATLADGTVAHV